MVYHIHKYKFDTLKSTGHNHVLLGYTDGMIGLDKFHFHHYYGVCSYNGHTHYYSGFTGLPVRTEHGHIHKMEGFVEYNEAIDGPHLRRWRVPIRQTGGEHISRLVETLRVGFCKERKNPSLKSCYNIHHKHKYCSYTYEDIEQIRSTGYKIFAIGDR